MTVEQRLSLVTLGCADVARAKAFYVETLGWTPFFDAQETVFFDLGGFILALWTHRGLSEDMKRDVHAAPDAYRGFSLAYNARSEAEVDSIFARLKAAGAAILREPERMSWGGYSGYFADVDGHPWEVAFNPAWEIDAEGRVRPKKDSAS